MTHHHLAVTGHLAEVQHHLTRFDHPAGAPESSVHSSFARLSCTVDHHFDGHGIGESRPFAVVDWSAFPDKGHGSTMKRRLLLAKLVQLCQFTLRQFDGRVKFGQPLLQLIDARIHGRLFFLIETLITDLFGECRLARMHMNTGGKNKSTDQQ